MITPIKATILMHGLDPHKATLDEMLKFLSDERTRLKDCQPWDINVGGLFLEAYQEGESEVTEANND